MRDARLGGNPIARRAVALERLESELVGDRAEDRIHESRRGPEIRRPATATDSERTAWGAVRSRYMSS